MKLKVITPIILLTLSSVCFAKHKTRLLNPQVINMPQLLGDSRGTPITLTNSAGSGGTIRSVKFSDDKIYWYPDIDCNGAPDGSRDAITGGSGFEFTNGTAFYFGQNALASITGGDADTECIKMGLYDSGDANGVTITISGLSCNSTECTGGVVTELGNTGNWSVTGGP